MTPKKLPFISIFLSLTLFLNACGGGSDGRTVFTTDVDVSSFNGTWFGPCFNNNFGFSARQKITINSTSLISEISSYTAGITPSPNCILPSGGILISSDVTATMAYGSTVSNGSGCVNSLGVNTTINLTRFESSGNTATSQPDLNDGVEFVTSSRNDFLPDSSVICRKTNGNLLFAGQEYTGGTNTSIVDTSGGGTVPNTNVSWKVGNFNYLAGADGSASGTGSIGNTGIDDFGTLLVTTTGTELLNSGYSGSDISISHTLQGAGTYSIGTTTDLISNISSKRMTLQVAVGLKITPLAASAYVGSGQSAVATVDANGKYHFTIGSPIQLSKSVDVGTGVPNAPATIGFSMNNIHDFSN